MSAQVERVFDAISDIKQLRAWFPRCESAEWADGATPAKGARRVIMLEVKGRRLRSEQEVVEYDPPTSFGWRHVADTIDGKPFEMLAEPSLRFDLAPKDGGTKVQVTATWGLKGLKAKLAGHIVRRIVQDETAEVLDHLKTHVES
jgi:carbon monoxide dehydrogenase subunit G